MVPGIIGSHTESVEALLGWYSGEVDIFSHISASCIVSWNLTDDTRCVTHDPSQAHESTYLMSLPRNSVLEVVNPAVGARATSLFEGNTCPAESTPACGASVRQQRVPTFFEGRT